MKRVILDTNMTSASFPDKIKIIVDLDVVTVSIWDKKGANVKAAVSFTERVKKGEFHVVTPYFLLELVSRWKYSELKDYIEEFYLKNTDEMLTNEDLDKRFASMNIDDKRILTELTNRDIKGEDSLLVLVASAFGVDYLVTFNRVHLHNKKSIINEVLEKNGTRTIEIAGPEEV
ncbi:MAG: hypothetical protein HY514_02180 [Candidatus Aenigmarchaeota archaeon]|nr:hypothetical protein [Candidatus Aenigmarchaeota archaeon]